MTRLVAKLSRVCSRSLASDDFDQLHQAYLYDGYWEDIGTIESFYLANLALTKDPNPNFRCLADCCRCTCRSADME